MFHLFVGTYTHKTTVGHIKIIVIETRTQHFRCPASMVPNVQATAYMFLGFPVQIFSCTICR